MEGIDLETGNLPDYVNWVEEYKVTDVRNQGFCGACWSFAGVSTIESHLAIKYDYSPVNHLSV